MAENESQNKVGNLQPIIIKKIKNKFYTYYS